MSELNLGLRQFGPSVPDRTTLLVAGYCNSGKTTFAAMVARCALQQGQRVAYIDVDHSFRHNIISYAITRMAQTGPGLFYTSLLDLIPYQVVDVEEVIAEGLRVADLVVVDQLPLSLLRAADAEAHGPDAWRAILTKLTRAVAHLGRRAVVTYSVSRTARPGERALPPAIDPERNDPLPDLTSVYPLLMEHDLAAHIMTVEMRKVHPGQNAAVPA